MKTEKNDPIAESEKVNQKVGILKVQNSTKPVNARVVDQVLTHVKSHFNEIQTNANAGGKSHLSDSVS